MKIQNVYERNSTRTILYDSSGKTVAIAKSLGPSVGYGSGVSV
jgi:hypothetical protein